MIVHRTEIDAMDRRYRAALVNSLPGLKPANLIGTISKDGLTNLAIVSSVVHIGSDPPLLAFISRPLSVERHTLHNIVETGVYTINAVPTQMINQAHQTAARYDREVSEFDAAGINSVYQEGFPAPFVAESPLAIGMRYVTQTPLPNSTVVVIGEVDRINLPEGSIRDDGGIDFADLGTVAVTGLDSYFTGAFLTRLAYATPG